MAIKKEKIIAAAIQLANKDGLDSLSMRRLAAKLKIEAMSLYHHFKNKDEILNALVDHAFALIEWNADPSDWKQSLRQRCYSLRDVLKKNPWAVGLLESRRNPGLKTLKHHDQMLGLFLKSGFSHELTAHSYVLLDSYVYGFAVQERSVPVNDSNDISDMAESIFSGLSPETVPNMIEMITSYYTKPGYSFAAEFEYGLDVILNGIEKKYKDEKHKSKEISS
ncbi:MAG: TetR/AcrR family transcriptional regulator [Bdellovibrionaceae bacterium]|nr:TetR/AcrR family transcriptional regulator [Pseudobdellovibrionaceae bacterium]